MAWKPISLLLRRRILLNPNLYYSVNHHSLKPYSTAQPTPTSSNPSTDPNKPSNLSARLSFVFDQIDAIERERSQKDETLQRIRAWRESKKQSGGTTAVIEDDKEKKDGLGEMEKDLKVEGKLKKEVVLVHPWPEWIELMERLVQQNYFDLKREDEDSIVKNLGFDIDEVVQEGFDFTRDIKTVLTACLNFGKDRFDILRSLSRNDIQVLVGFGCPSTSSKVVFASKLLRKHVHLDEGDVCSNCSLRSTCERGYLLTNKEDEARTIDIMRVLLTYGFDPINGSVMNKSLLKKKSVKTVVRKLLHMVVKLSAVPIDPSLPPPVIKRPPPKVKIPPPPPRKRVGRDDVEMKKGDWLCPKCDFMNFAKNTVCLQCDAKRPKRQLLPGEWECPECNFLNYRRNMACFHCECKRPRDEFMETQMQERQDSHRNKFERVPGNREDISNAWNLNFDDDESDGADVAAFEYADSARMGGNFPSDVRPRISNVRGFKDDIVDDSSIPDSQGRIYADASRPGTGFDDFDDEDDVESYEVDTHDTVVKRDFPTQVSDDDFSDLEDIKPVKGGRGDPFPREKPHRPMRANTKFSGSDDDHDLGSDEDLSVHPDWKSSHVANSNSKPGIRQNGPSRALSFGSDEEFSPGSDSEDDFGGKRSKNQRGVAKSKNKGRSDVEDEYGSELGGDNRLRGFRGGRGDMGRGRFGSERGGRNEFRGKPGRERADDFVPRDEYKFTKDSSKGFRGKPSGRGRGRNSFRGGHDSDSFDDSEDDDFRGSSRTSRGSNRGRRGGNNFRGSKDSESFDDFRDDDLSRSSRGTNRGVRRGGNRGGGQRGGFDRELYGRAKDKFSGACGFNDDDDNGGRDRQRPRRGGFSDRQRGGSNNKGFNRKSSRDMDFNDDRPRRERIIER
ncbi:unnamed protein product [Rhodiola kirilowii]